MTVQNRPYFGKGRDKVCSIRAFVVASYFCAPTLDRISVRAHDGGGVEHGGYSCAVASSLPSRLRVGSK